MRGFTLMETLVAVTILLVGVIGPLTIAVRGITDGMFARNQISANYLAQEAVEVILARRLSNSSSPSEPPAWSGLSDCFPSGTICVVDAKYHSGVEPIQKVDDCSNDKCSLVFDKDAGYFRQPPVNNPVGPVFQRTIKMEPSGAGADDSGEVEVKVTVTVEWFNFALARSLSLVENLYTYYPGASTPESPLGGEPPPGGDDSDG